MVGRVSPARAPLRPTDLNTLLTALYVRIDDWLGHQPPRGRKPQLTDAELLTLAVAQVLLGIHSEARWLRYVPEQLSGAFPYLPGQSGYNKRPHKACRCSSGPSGCWPATPTCGPTRSGRPTPPRSSAAG